MKRAVTLDRILGAEAELADVVGVELLPSPRTTIGGTMTPMTDEVPPVVVAEGSPLRMIALNRPEHRNALNAELHTALVATSV